MQHWHNRYRYVNVDSQRTMNTRINEQWKWRSTAMRMSSANIFLLFFFYLLAHRYRPKWGGKREEQRWSDGARLVGGWRLAVRDVRFKNAQRALCQDCLWPYRSSSADDKPTRGISGCWQAFIYDAGRRNGFARSARNAGFNRYRVNGIDDPLSRWRRVIDARANLGMLCVTRIRDPVCISNATIFGNIARVTRWPALDWTVTLAVESFQMHRIPQTNRSLRYSHL